MLKELALIGFANAGDYFDWAPDGVSLLDKGDLTEVQRREVASDASRWARSQQK